jgi:hypothetical protein
VITIRDKDFKVILRRPGLRRLIDRNRRVAVERVDIWPGVDGRAQLGVTWVDGSSTITDVSSLGALREWCSDVAAFKGKIHDHS